MLANTPVIIPKQNQIIINILTPTSEGEPIKPSEGVTVPPSESDPLEPTEGVLIPT